MKPQSTNEVDARRAAANRRTVAWLAVVAVLIYVAFILSGVVGAAK